MPTASIKLSNGTEINIEGTPEEVAKLLAIYNSSSGKPPAFAGNLKNKRPKQPKSSKKTATKNTDDNDDSPDISEIVNHIKNCDEAELIETKVLDKVGQVNRVLLPMYIVHEHMENQYHLTSGDISKVTVDLGIPIKTPNVSVALSGTASKYVMGDKVRKKGQPVRYKLSRRGIQYFKEILKD